jgi:hypothetical protein
MSTDERLVALDPGVVPAQQLMSEDVDPGRQG